MDSVGIVRIALLGVLLAVLSIGAYKDLLKYVDSPIGRKDALEYEQIEFFPAVTVCPWADPEVVDELALGRDATFKHAIDMAMSPGIFEQYYITFK